MKKSEAIRKAMHAVIDSQTIYNKGEIIDILAGEELLARLMEEAEERKDGTV